MRSLLKLALIGWLGLLNPSAFALPAPTIDSSAIGPMGGSGTTGTITLTTSQTNDIIILNLTGYYVNFTNCTGANAITITGVSGGSLTFLRRGGVTLYYSSTYCFMMDEWWALATSTLSSVTFTFTFNQTTSQNLAKAVSVNGVGSLVAPFDIHAGLPGSVSFVDLGGTTPLTITGVSTTQGNDLILGFCSYFGSTQCDGGSGGGQFTNVGSVAVSGASLAATIGQMTISSPLSSASLTPSFTNGQVAQGLADALSGPVPSSAGGLMLRGVGN